MFLVIDGFCTDSASRLFLQSLVAPATRLSLNVTLMTIFKDN